MWVLRFLNGSQAGKEVLLQEGQYTVGRSEECQITLSEDGVSKKHIQLDLSDEGIFVKDLNSSNGTFVNGLKIQESLVELKDKISLYRSTFDIVLAPQHPPAPVSAPSAIQGQPQATAVAQDHGIPSSVATEGQTPSAPIGEEKGVAQVAPKELLQLTLKNWFKNYIDTVVLPGVYKLPSWLDLKWVIGGFLVFFVVVMTALSSIPLIRILNASIEQESMNHAESIATTLAQMNHSAVRSKIQSSITVDYALRRQGVSKAFIINAVDGRILAPSEKAHTYSNIPFIHSARRKETTSVEKISHNTVAAMVPIQFFNPETKTHRAEAYAAVIYNAGTLASGNQRVISLLVQTCFIALVLGALLFFFLYKMIEYPIKSLNNQLSSALKDDTLDVQTDYQFEPLQNLSSNINSALARLLAAQEVSQSIGEYDRQTEMAHIIEMIGYPTLGINVNTRKIEGASAHFEEETGVSTERILNCTIEDIDDQALKLNIIGLLEKIEQHPHEIATDTLEFSGVEFQLSAKGIYGKDSLAYVVVSFIPVNQQQEGAS